VLRRGRYKHRYFSPVPASSQHKAAPTRAVQSAMDCTARKHKNPHAPWRTLAPCPVPGDRREPHRPSPPADTCCRLGGKLPVHAHHRPRAGHSADRILPRVHCLPGVDRHRRGRPRAVGLPGQAGCLPGAGHDQLRYPGHLLFRCRSGIAGRLLGDLQRHHATDGRADRHAVLPRAHDPGQVVRHLPWPVWRRHPQRRRPGRAGHGPPATALPASLPAAGSAAWTADFRHWAACSAPPCC